MVFTVVCKLGEEGATVRGRAQVSGEEEETKVKSWGGV
ncbi:hypothetical protein NC653_011382 [Populus alba x Populus x berolinensis]|uniref:Uncharacterized protein n=1 Tax=Populus alba x Populus x berolinensis TaxID=444605 RepID=A0AAD6W6E2_9ROSI|nr:hypothetical protein NC653_011382 [Populus alba x Populus x berolinensis]